jgi:opacity protein-like surface antigen
MKRAITLLAVVILAFSAPAFAALGPGNGEIGFNYGSTQLDSDTGFDSATSLAVRGGYFFNRNFEIEGQLASSSEDTEVLGTNVDGKFRMYMVNGVYNFQTPKEIVPYVLAGVGMMDTTVEDSTGSISDNSTAYQLGAGSRFFFGKTKKTAFRFDVSMIQASTFDETSTHTNVSAGFSWRLGGR